MTGKIPENAKWATCHFGFGPRTGETDENSSCVLPSSEISNTSYLRIYLRWSLFTCIYTVPLVEFMYLVFTLYLWSSVGTLYLHACQVRVTVGDSRSGLCCTCVAYFER